MVVARPAPRRVARAVDVGPAWQQTGEPVWEVVEVDGGVRMGELFDAFLALEVRKKGSGWESAWIPFGGVAWGWPGGAGGKSWRWPKLAGLGQVDLVLTKDGAWSTHFYKRQRAHVCWGPGERGGGGGNGRSGRGRGSRRCLGRRGGSIRVRSLIPRGVWRGRSGDEVR